MVSILANKEEGVVNCLGFTLQQGDLRGIQHQRRSVYLKQPGEVESKSLKNCLELDLYNSFIPGAFA